MARAKKSKGEGEPVEKAPKARREKPTKGGKAAKPTSAGGGKGRRFVLIIGDEGGILIFMQGTKVVRRLFAPSPQPSHTEAMHEIMTSHPRVPIYILADVLDQQYVAQTFPPVSSLSVGGLVKRRLDRDFQADDMTGALPLGRDKTGRKEWKFLLVSLARTQLMSDWLDLVLELPNELKGIYLVPVEAVNYVAALNKKASSDKPRPWQLFISHNKVSGFRQVVIHEGKLVFTRVSQAIDDAIPAVIAGNIEQEIINTMEYLKRLGFQENADLDATVIISQDVIESLDLKRFGFAHINILSPLGVSEALGLEQAALSADRFGDVVMAAAFGIAKKRVLRFSNAYMEKLAKLYKTQMIIRAAMWLLSVGLFGLTAMTVVDVISNYSTISEINAKIQQNTPKLEQAKKSVEGLNKDIAYKSATVATYDAYIKDTPRPEDFAAAIAPFISPAHRLLSMDWQYNEPNAKSPPPGGTALPVEVVVEFDFGAMGSSATTEALNKAAAELLESMKAGMPQYDVTNEPYPWVKVDKQEEAVSVDVVSVTTILPQDMIAKFRFRGVKKVAATPGAPGGAPGGAAAAPGAAPAAMPPGMPGGPPRPGPGGAQ